ncbi:hypothetical protein EK21DRAFT_61569 [Setomelanomma holmii]|uniref:Uncharacterized protein n=1 Tax=Setomelanomma holmii TaxID=210430 RepID=A0A9P4HF74_9PLEO|nr:hypothetical protein EK21DRAFT_61569 [Setomelanomma holmii]
MAIKPELISELEKKELIIADTVSVTSTTTLGASELSFIPAKSFHITTRGRPVFHLPLPPFELEIVIHSFDGSVAYTSKCTKRSSGNCVLSGADGKSLISTSYFFGPSKDLLLCRLDVAPGTTYEIKTTSKWTSRDHTFSLPDGRTFAWQYKREVGFGAKGTKGTALALVFEGKRFAALIRNDETRTPGSKCCSAGNGGELVLSEHADGKNGLAEEVVIAICLLMLKKEID